MQTQKHFLCTNVLWACMASACVVGCPAALFAAHFGGASAASLVASGTGGLILAQVFRCAASLHRCNMPLMGFSRWRLCLGFVSVLLTAFAVVCVALGSDPNVRQRNGWLYGCIVGLLLLERTTNQDNLLGWSAYPPQPSHHRFAKQLKTIAVEIVLYTIGAVVALCVFTVSLGGGQLLVCMAAGAGIILTGEILIIGLQSSTAWSSSAQPPDVASLVVALSLPLASSGHGFERWMALSSLAQEGAPDTSAQSPYNRAGLEKGTLLNWALLDDGRSLFAVYFHSARDVVWQVIGLLGCLANAPSMHTSSTDRLNMEVRPEERQIVELDRLFGIAVAGVVSWICRFRSKDGQDLVLREDALKKATSDLLVALTTLAALLPFADTIHPSMRPVLQRVEETCTESLGRLLRTFEVDVFRQMQLPEPHVDLLTDISKALGEGWVPLLS